MNKLIGQLLTMARVDSGVDLERPTRFDLGSVVEEVSTDAEYEARTRECAVEFNQRGECVVEGAREMLRGAVENVVRNAVRHTGDRTRVEVSLDAPACGDRVASDHHRPRSRTGCARRNRRHPVRAVQPGVD